MPPSRLTGCTQDGWSAERERARTIACRQPSRSARTPRFDGEERRVEAYVLDRTDLDLYGERVAIDFAKRLRPTLKFDSVDELIVQMAADVKQTRVATVAW